MRIPPLSFLILVVLAAIPSARAAQEPQPTTLSCEHMDMWSEGEETKAICTGKVTVTGTNIIDTTAANGTTYYYVVSAANIAGESADSAEANATPQVGPYRYWPFDETSGATAVDAWSNRNGTLASGATWSAGAFNHGV